MSPMHDLTDDDRARLNEIAGEIEHLPVEFCRHFDQDGRDVRFLRKLAEQSSGDQGLREDAVSALLLSDRVVDAVAEAEAIEELYGHWEDSPSRENKEARQRQRYAQLAKKPGVQQSWKSGTRTRIRAILAAAFPGPAAALTDSTDNQQED